MSWGTTYEFDTELTETGNLEIILTDAMQEQKDAVEWAVTALIKTGALGTNKKFKVTVTGHANDNHEPTSGWVNDRVSINIYQLEEE